MSKPPASLSDFVLFTVTAVIAVLFQRKMSAKNKKKENQKSLNYDSSTCSKKKENPKLMNSAFVFIKPHANTKQVQDLVRDELAKKDIKILTELDISGEEIDSKKLIDQHYYAIASKATLLSAPDIPVPVDKFEAKFGEKWDKVLAEGRAVNAMEACAKFNCDAKVLDEAWGKAKVEKFGGGFYCGLVTVGSSTPLYVFNAFFMTMRSKFVGKDTSIHCYVVEWDPAKLSWSSFRGELLGPTDPKEAPSGAIRKLILDKYKELGLTSEPNKGDNGVHASASPFEGLAEKTNWLKMSINSDAFGKALLDNGLSSKTIQDWSVDPRVTVSSDGEKASIFDTLEDMDVDECLKKLVEVNELNASSQ